MSELCKENCSVKINTGRIEFIDSLRCIAVLSVVFYHFYCRFCPPISPINYLPFQSKPFFLLNYGYYGVQLFFVISGFVIFHTLTSSDSFSMFIKKRLIRLLPALVLCSVITFVVQQFVPHSLDIFRSASYCDFLPGITFTPPQIWNFLLSRNDISYIDFVYWSLFVEMVFYLVGGFIFFLRPEKFAVNWISLTFVSMGIRILTSPRLHSFFPRAVNTFFDQVYGAYTLLHLSYWIYFALGIFFYQLYSRKELPSLKMIAVILTMVCIEFYFLVKIVLILYLTVIIALFLIFVYKPKWLNFLNQRVFLWIGFISYPLYLMHQNIGLILINKLATWIDVLPINKYIPLFVLVILCLVGHIISTYFETPVSKFLRPRLMHWKKNNS